MLKSLELFGFKSFADRTKFDFSPGITAVVGPNGSGKSNVVDGIKWILGDQSPKSLRGKEMTDVIFNGAAGRKASQLAEATLTFDNAGGFLPIDAPEVQIGRRLWRSGDSEYLINRTPARLKDIRDLLMGTGAGSAAYNIIEQGRVDQILQANAASRRTIFEEAAGISKYKARKLEALRRLERIDQNLVRLRDMVEELQTRLGSLRSQAAKAAQFREVSEQLQTLWQGLAADDCRYLTRQRDQLDEQVRRCAEELDGSSGRQQELESKLAALDGQLAELDDRLRQIEKQRAANRETIAGHEATVRHQSARRRELESDIVRLRRQRTLMAGRVRETVGELAHLREHLAAVDAEFTRRRAEREDRTTARQTLHAGISEARAAVEQHRRRLLERMRAVSAAESRVAAMQMQIDGTAAAAESVLTRRDALDRQLAAQQSACATEQADLQTAAEALTAAQAHQRRLQSDRRALADAERRCRQTLAELRERRSAEQARLAVLEDMDRRQPGLGIGVKEILDRAATLDYPPWNRIRGVVADLLQAGLDHAPLLETALGDRAQLVVIEELDSLVEYVTSESCRILGRVGFVAHLPPDAPGTAHAAFEHFRLDPAALPDLSGQPGVVMRADRLVGGVESRGSRVQSQQEAEAASDSQLPSLAAQLLSDTWVTETLDAALALSAGVGRGCRFVTLQGERLDPDGTLTVGTPRTETALVTRKGELRGLKNELLRLDHGIAQEERRLQEFGDLLAQCDADLEAAETAVREASEQHSTRQNCCHSVEQELARQQREREALDAELNRLAADEQRWQAEREAALVEQQQTADELQSLQTALEAAEREAAECEQRLSALEQQENADQLDLAKHEERVGSLRTACERLETEHQQRLLQQDEAERRSDAAAARLREITLHILNTSAVTAELILAGETFTREIEGLLDERTLLRTRRGELVQEETALRKRRRELTDSQHQHEMRRRDLEHQLETLAQRIEEEYQIALPEIIASGASALRLYIEEHQPADHDDSSPPKPAGRGPWGEDPDADAALFAQIRGELDERVNRLRRKLRSMGAVDTESLTSLDDLERRYALQSAQLQDLTEARNTLEEIVRRINAESKRLFLETFEEVRGHFQHLFRKAFGGGDGDIVLEDPNDVLECGIEIVARPPGKELKSLSLLSGGEKALTAFALLLALFKTRPSPYCLLDEVDAPLDEANVGRLGALLEEFKGSTQFIVITHKKPTMTIADVLYGVTMEQSGVSKRMSVRFEDISENGEFTGQADSPAQANRAA